MTARSRNILKSSMKLSKKEAEKWIRTVPKQFQRPITEGGRRFKEKVAEITASGGVIPGIITFVTIGDDDTWRLVDGQHRFRAFIVSEVEDAVMDVCICACKDMGEAARLFQEINVHIKNMNADDFFRAAKEYTPTLMDLLRRGKGIVGITAPGNVKRAVRGTGHAAISVASALHTWFASSGENPILTRYAKEALAAKLSVEEVDRILSLLGRCNGTWGKDAPTLWRTLNLATVCWIYRRAVLGEGDGQHTELTVAEFDIGLTALAADEHYVTKWLYNRRPTMESLIPAYMKITKVMGKAIKEETGKRVRWPSIDHWYFPAGVKIPRSKLPRAA